MINFSVWSWSQGHVEPPFFAWSRSRPNLVGAGAIVSSGTSDFRSQSRPKKWRLLNTAYNTFRFFQWFVFNCLNLYTICPRDLKLVYIAIMLLFYYLLLLQQHQNQQQCADCQNMTGNRVNSSRLLSPGLAVRTPFWQLSAVIIQMYNT